MSYTREQVLQGRQVIDAYRLAHNQFHLTAVAVSKPVSVQHTPLIEKMLADLEAIGFGSWDEFNNASELLNVQEVGFASLEDFENGAKTSDLNKIEVKWH